MELRVSRAPSYPVGVGGVDEVPPGLHEPVHDGPGRVLVTEALMAAPGGEGHGAQAQPTHLQTSLAEK